MKCFVRCYTGQGSGSKLIQAWERSDISHVSLVFHMHGSAQEIESIQKKGVIQHAPHKACHKQFIEYAVPLTDEQIIDAHILAMSFIGAKYDYTGVVSFLLHRTKHSKDKWFCSEFVAYILLKVGYALSRRIPWLESPESISSSYRLIAPADEIGSA